MHQIRVRIEKVLRLSLLRDATQLIIQPRPSTSWPATLRPERHGGMRAEHLSLPLAPRRDPPNVGALNIHLTYRDGHRETIATPTLEDLAAFSRELENALVDHLRQVGGRVTPEELVREGVEIFLPTSEARAWMRNVVEENFLRPKRAYEVTATTFDRMREFESKYEPTSPLALHHTRTDLRSELPYILGVHPEGFRLSLVYFPGWFDDDEGPGWIVTPWPLVTDEMLVGMVGRLLGPRFWETLFVAARELQADCDYEKLRQLAGGAAATAFATSAV